MEFMRFTYSDMSTSNSQENRDDRKVLERSHDKVVPFTADVSKRASKGSPRFGALSHHSFFSRHNPHPHRVTHIQGLNGNPVCMVKDDWGVTTSLFPHPLLKSQVFSSSSGAPFASPFGLSLYGGNSNNKYRTALLSEAWKEELKDLAAKVSVSAQAKKDKDLHNAECAKSADEEVVCRRTQYSAQTGRIIPPSSQGLQRRRLTQRQSQPPGPALYDQELMVLELLCQILQTDSFSLVQKWLLLAGQREKDLVMGLIQQAMEDSAFSRHQQRLYETQTPHPRTCTSLPGPVSTCGPQRGKQSYLQRQHLAGEDKPEMIGDAEVLEVHSGTQHPPQDQTLQKDHIND